MKLKAFVVSLVALAFTFTGMSGYSANFNNLSFMGFYMETHPTTVNAFLPFFKKVEKDLNGEVTFNYFSSNVLYPESECYQVLRDGRIDFGSIRPANFPGVVNLMTVVDVPGIARNAVVGSLLAQELMDTYPEIVAEFPKEAVPFTAWASEANQYHSIKPIKSLEEFKGQKVIVWDSVLMDTVLALGGNPIRLTSTDTYLSLSKGMADGVFCPLAPIRALKITDIAKHHFLLDAGVGSFNMFIYKPLWDEFTPEIQEYFTQESGSKFALEIGKTLKDGAVRDTKWMADLGHSFYTISDEDRAKMETLLNPFKENWLKAMEEKGYTNAADILKFVEERVQYYQSEYDKGTYGDYAGK